MKTLPNSWQASLQTLLSQKTTHNRIAIVGIGNTLRSDDAAGVLVARALMASRVSRDRETVLILDAGHAPENGTCQLRRFEPDLILLIDAAEMAEAPGTTRLIGMDEIEGMSASTHSLPLSMLARYLTLELGCDVKLLGIQPKSNEIGEILSLDVNRSVQLLAEFLSVFIP